MSVIEQSDKFNCDLCGKEVVTHDGEPPVGWQELTLVRIPVKGIELGDFSGATVDEWDVCSKECTERTIAETGKLVVEIPPNLRWFLTGKQQEPEPIPETLEKPESMTRKELVAELQDLLAGRVSARAGMAISMALKTVQRVADMASLDNDEAFEV